MSTKTRWALVYAAGFVISGSACATGGKGGNGDDDPIDAAVTTRMDANTSVTIDAPGVKLDGGVTPPPDAFVQPPPPDAATSLFCSQNSQCTNAGECCITLSGPMGFCGPGTVILGQCVPQ